MGTGVAKEPTEPDHQDHIRFHVGEGASYLAVQSLEPTSAAPLLYLVEESLLPF